MTTTNNSINLKDGLGAMRNDFAAKVAQTSYNNKNKQQYQHLKTESNVDFSQQSEFIRHFQFPQAIAQGAFPGVTSLQNAGNVTKSVAAKPMGLSSLAGSKLNNGSGSLLNNIESSKRSIQQKYQDRGTKSTSKKRKLNRSPPLMKDESIPIFNLGTPTDILKIIDRVQRNAKASTTLSTKKSQKKLQTVPVNQHQMFCPSVADLQLPEENIETIGGTVRQ